MPLYNLFLVVFRMAPSSGAALGVLRGRKSKGANLFQRGVLQSCREQVDSCCCLKTALWCWVRLEDDSVYRHRCFKHGRNQPLG